MRSLKMRIVIGGLVFLVAIYQTFDPVFAAEQPASWKPGDCIPTSRLYKERNEVLMSDCCVSDQQTEDSGSTSTVSAGSDCKGEPLPDTIPQYWRELIDKAAEKHPDTDRRLVAATLWVENRGWPDPNKNWATSGAGAQGPWQFIPSSWDAFGEDCNGDGQKNINDPEDSVCAAFNHLKGSACKPILEGATGDAESDYTNVAFKRDGNNTLMSALANYNGSGTRDGVAIGQQGRGENPDYVKMGYWLIASGFKESIDVETGEKIDATSAGNPDASGGSPGSGSGSSAASETECEESDKDKGQTGSGTPIDIDGRKYAFPVLLGKDEVTNNPGEWPCPGNCHHDGMPALDLSRNAKDDSSEGVPIIAITDGTISSIQVYEGNAGCYFMSLDGDDGKSYYYIHFSSPPADGAKVTAGQQIGNIGRRACTGNGSYPHLHIDINGKSDPAIVPLVNELHERLGSGGASSSAARNV